MRRASFSRTDCGFTLVESLVATALLLAVTGSVFALVQPGTAGSASQPAAVDMQQRARVTAEVLLRDLVAAGAGVDGGLQRGPLVRFIAPILPRRAGPNADAFSVARADAITIVSVHDTAAQSTLAAALAPGATQMAVNAGPQCPAASQACGIGQGDDLIVFDTEGHFDLFAVLGVSPGIADVRAHGGSASHAYPAGSAVAVATSRTYYLDAALRQLRYSDGDQTDVPLADHVVGLAFEYLGDPLPPTLPQPPLGTANCLFASTGAPTGGLAVLPSQGGSLAALPVTMFADGPWCGAGARQFDADLLRVRQVRVTVRVEAALDTLRSTGSAFATAGLSRSALLALPDYEIRVTAAPRNLQWAR
jgi:hypothetical protein